MRQRRHVHFGIVGGLGSGDGLRHAPEHLGGRLDHAAILVLAQIPALEHGDRILAEINSGDVHFIVFLLNGLPIASIQVARFRGFSYD